MTFYPDYEIELILEQYEFYTLGVWEREEGYYIATDSGCSCPMPWEYYSSLDDTTGPLTFEQMAEEAMSLAEDSYHQEYAIHNVKGFLNDIR